MDPVLRQKAHRPELPAGPPTKVSDLAAFSVAQEATIAVMEGRLGDAVKAMDDCNTTNAALASTVPAAK